MGYEIFTRTWWKRNNDYPNGLEPQMGRSKFIKTVPTQEEAREYCTWYNDQKEIRSKSNKLGKKCEFRRM